MRIKIVAEPSVRSSDCSGKSLETLSENRAFATVYFSIHVVWDEQWLHLPRPVMSLFRSSIPLLPALIFATSSLLFRSTASSPPYVRHVLSTPFPAWVVRRGHVLRAHFWRAGRQADSKARISSYKVRTTIHKVYEAVSETTKTKSQRHYINLELSTAMYLTDR